jgi:hypothetical protein
MSDSNMESSVLEAALMYGFRQQPLSQCLLVSAQLLVKQ